MQDDLSAVFEALRAILLPYAPPLVVKTDTGTAYYLDTTHICKNMKPLFFAAVNINKSYVSFHLMPIYVRVALADKVSEALTKRRQGKVCFNFKAADPALFDELKQLTAAGFDYYKTNDMLAAV